MISDKFTGTFSKNDLVDSQAVKRLSTVTAVCFDFRVCTFRWFNFHSIGNYRKNSRNLFPHAYDMV